MDLFIMIRGYDRRDRVCPCPARRFMGFLAHGQTHPAARRQGPGPSIVVDADLEMLTDEDYILKFLRILE